MGKYFDFERPQSWSDYSSVGKSMGDIGDTIAKKKLDDQTMAMEKLKAESYAAQVAATNKKFQQDELRAKVTDARLAALDRKAASETIANMASGGRYGAAAAEAKSTQYEDPRNPGHMRGVDYRVVPPGPAPMEPRLPGAAPTAPAEPGMNVFPSQNAEDYNKPVVPSEGVNDYYKALPPDQARALAISRAQSLRPEPVLPSQNEADYQQQPPDLLEQAAGEQAAGVSERQQEAWNQFGQDQSQHEIDQLLYDVRKKAYPAEQKAYADRVARPNIELGYDTGRNGPDGKPVSDVLTIDPREQDLHKAARAKEMAADAFEMAKLEPDPAKRAEMQTRALMLATEASAADKAAVSQAGVVEAGIKGRADQQGEKLKVEKVIQAGHDRARIIAASLHGRNSGGFVFGADDGRVVSELKGNVEDVRRKGGLQEQINHQEGSLNALDAHPENNTNWTNAIDAMIRSNTGRAAIIAQYKMYTGKAASAEDAVDQFKEWIDTGGLSAEQKTSLYGAMLDSYAETVDQWNAAYDVANEYKKDRRVVGNSAVGEGVDRTIHSAFRGGKRKPRTATTVPGMPDVKLPGREPAPPPVASKPAEAHEPGETKTIKGVVYRKLGPNNWQPDKKPKAAK